MTSLKQILDTLEPQSDGIGWRGTIPDDWLQGRTSYGGLSAAMALHCALQSDTDLPLYDTTVIHAEKAAEWAVNK